MNLDLSPVNLQSEIKAIIIIGFDFKLVEKNEKIRTVFL